MDPYDHLYVGDLQVKLGNVDEAISHYESAIQQYSTLGFHRNGIALCRKILRLKPDYCTVYHHLGDLYAAEELFGDAMDAYFKFIEGLAPEERDGDELREVLGRAEVLAPRSPELALRLSKCLEDLDRVDHAAEILLRAAAVARGSAATQFAAELKAKADALDPDAAARMEAADLAEKCMDPTALQAPSQESAPPTPPSIEETSFEITIAPQEPAQAESGGDAPVEAPREPTAFGEIDLGVEPPAEAPVAPPPQDEGADLTIELESAAIPRVAAEAEAPALPESPEEEVVIEVPEAPAGNLADPASATLQAIEAEQWTSARKRAEEWIHQDHASMAAVDKLIEICETLEDNAGIAQGLSLKGDLFIREGELERAIPIFGKVLEIEPDNTTAQRRMQRFAQLGIKGATLPGEPGPIEAVLEANDAVVAVRADAPDASGDGAAQEDWLEIGALLDEFREGLKAQVGDDDPQVHYDLGLSHFDMELFEDAIGEFDAALGCAGLSGELELQIREMRGKGLSRLKRSGEAIEEYQRALAISGVGPVQQAGMRCLIGIEHQLRGDLDAAKASLKEALEFNPKLVEASQRLAALEGKAA